MPVRFLCPNASTLRTSSDSSQTYLPSSSFTPSETAMTMLCFFSCIPRTFSTKRSTWKGTSGRQIMSTPSQSSPFASAAAAVSQPALRPMISTMVTYLLPYTVASRMISFITVAMYFAALP